jgi:SNW domain-containing protein 1
MVEAQVDPMEPPKHKHSKVPRGPPSPPVPVLHSPPRKVTVEDQQAWKVPPCISNWKNAKGFTIPLDKRLAADGRGLQEVTINNKFAMLSEALYISERKAAEDLRIRNQLRKKLAMKEKEDREKELRDRVLRARAERTGAQVNDDDLTDRIDSGRHENLTAAQSEFLGDMNDNDSDDKSDDDDRNTRSNKGISERKDNGRDTGTVDDRFARDRRQDKDDIRDDKAVRSGRRERDDDRRQQRSHDRYDNDRNRFDDYRDNYKRDDRRDSDRRYDDRDDRYNDKRDLKEGRHSDRDRYHRRDDSDDDRRDSRRDKRNDHRSPDRDRRGYRDNADDQRGHRDNSDDGSRNKKRDRHEHSSSPHKRSKGNREDEIERIAREQREKIRIERRKERERELRLQNMKGNMRKNKVDRDQNRDISEKIALGMHRGTGQLTGEALFDSRLFNQSSGMDSGFGPDDEYNTYTKGLFDKGAASSIYRPKKDDSEMYGDADAQLAKLTDTSRFKPDKGFKGAESSGGGKRDAPVQFEKERRDDPFGIDDIVKSK